MEKSSISEVEFQLRKLITKYSDFFAYHQWPSEHERWVELVFALVSRTSNKPESEVRDIIEELDDLGLLDIEELSNIPKVGSDIDYNSPFAKRVLVSLSEARLTEEGLRKPGFTEEESKSSLLIMHEAAKSLMERHDGKIQKYLRKYGQQMIDELSENFSFSGMHEKDIKDAFIYWLQNVLNMSVNLRTKSTNTFCEKLKIGCNELVKEADELDINLALLDDMVEQYISDLERGSKNE